jgi:uncharacterized membrane protein YadS
MDNSYLEVTEPGTTYKYPVVGEPNTFLLAWSFAGIGLKVKASSIRKIGLKSFLGGIAVALIAGAGSAGGSICGW